MADLARWNPFDELQRLRAEMTKFIALEWLVPQGERGQADWGPSVDVRETATHIVVSAEIPGINPDDLDVIVTEDGLSLRGEVRQESDSEEQGYQRLERRYGSFYRIIPFPVCVKHEQAEADYKGGVLQITVPKAEPGRERATKLRINEPK